MFVKSINNKHYYFFVHILAGLTLTYYCNFLELLMAMGYTYDFLPRYRREYEDGRQLFLTNLIGQFADFQCM